MNLFRTTPRESFGEFAGRTVGSGLAGGLQHLLDSKLDEVNTRKEHELYQRAGFRPEAAELLTHLRKVDPQHFHQYLSAVNPRTGEQGAYGPMQPIIGKSPSTNSPQLEKVRHDIGNIDSLLDNLDEMEALINNTKDPVDFSYSNAALSKIPGGNYFYGKNFGFGQPEGAGSSTGAFDALSNKFHTDAVQNAKNIRSLEHVRLYGKSKPGVDKTKAQNLQLIPYWRKQLLKEKEQRLKSHPELIQEFAQNQYNQQPQSVSEYEPRQQVAQQSGGQKMKAVERNGQLYRYNEANGQYDIPIMRRG